MSSQIKRLFSDRSLLDYACNSYVYNIAFIKTLINERSLEIVDNHNMNALMYVCQNDNNVNCELIKLLSNKNTVNQINIHGENAIMILMKNTQKHNFDFAQTLYDVDNNIINHINNNGDNALMIYCQRMYHNINIIRLLSTIKTKTILSNNLFNACMYYSYNAHAHDVDIIHDLINCENHDDLIVVNDNDKIVTNDMIIEQINDYGNNSLMLYLCRAHKIKKNIIKCLLNDKTKNQINGSDYNPLKIYRSVRQNKTKRSIISMLI